MDDQKQFESVRDLSQRLERCAVIDVGTNAVKLLVADLGRELKPVLKLSLPTGLGQGAFQSRSLKPEAMARTVAAVAEFAAEATALSAASIRVVATSATREATYGDELGKAIRLDTGLSVEFISGEQKADFVFHGVTSDPLIGPQPVLIVNVGGGSTEWVVGENRLIIFRMSTRIGTVLSLELCPPGDPPSLTALARLRAIVGDFIRTEVHPSLQPVLRAFRGRGLRLVGLGGALKALARLVSFPAPLNSSNSLLRERLGEQVERLWRLSVQERRRLPGMDMEKAEVILPGSVIHEAVLSQFEFAEILISGRGLREGLLLSPWN